MKRSKKKAKLNIGLIVTLIILLGGLIGTYFWLGFEATIILGLGISLILFIARLLDKAKKKKKQMKI